ncbi:flagellar protein FlaG [Thiocystis violacea]|uniref:flagellar protein FlaG n=1 Tax=Thiocystis violacea TaxID=13725 RepID=UPI001A91E00A
MTALEFLRQRQRPLERGANPQASGSFSLAELHRRSAQPLRFVELLSDHLQRVRRRIECASDAETGRIVIRVIDRASHEVVREIPFEEALACLGPVFKRGRIDWSRLT